MNNLSIHTTSPDEHYLAHDGPSQCDLTGPFGHCSLTGYHHIHVAKGGAGNVLGRWRVRTFEQKEKIVSQWE